MELSYYHLSNEQRDFLQIQYVNYYDKICNYVRSRGFKNDEVERIASNVFMKAIENLTSFEDRGNSFGAWIFKIASNEICQTFRDIKKLRIEMLSENELLIEDHISVSEENNQILVSALKKLSDKQLAIIKLRYYEKMSFREISNFLGISESNAKVKCFRTLEKLKLIFSSIDQQNL